MLSMHDGQCRFDMKMVVVTVSGKGWRILPVWFLDVAGDILIQTGLVQRCLVVQYIEFEFPGCVVLGWAASGSDTWR